MRILLGGISLFAFFLAIGLVLLAISDGVHAATIIIIAFGVLLLAYFANLAARRYR